MSSILPELLITLNISFLVVVLECLVGILFIAFALTFIFLVRRKKQIKQLEKNYQAMDNILSDFQLSMGLLLPKETTDSELLNYLSEKMQPMVEALIEKEEGKNQVEEIVIPVPAEKTIQSAAMSLQSTVNSIIDLCMGMVHAAGSCLFFCNSNRVECISTLGLDKELEDCLSHDGNIFHMFKHLLEEQNFIAVDREQSEFSQIPAYLAATGMKKVLLFRVSLKEGQGIVAIWLNHKISLEHHQIYGLQVVLDRLGDAVESYLEYQKLSMPYLDALKVLVSAVDNLAPYMVGYSDLMSRYAGIIAKEMKLDEQEVKDIVLAAYLSNIGVIGMPTELLFKDGRYSELEYERMKLHAELGASIVEVTLGNSNIAAYVRYHHERLDGRGYPHGLKGKEIPLGARIIAVVQFFIAKTIGRKYREPLPFEQSIKLLKEAAGSQLDPDAVEALVIWFRKKQAKSSRSGKSLGSCWEMRCSPESICTMCYAYKKTERNCWEYPNVNCTEHGNTCTACFVYTEYAYRTLDQGHGELF